MNENEKLEEKNMEAQRTILLVEDDCVIAESQACHLRNANFGVICTYSGEDAIEVCANNSHIDLVLIDIDLGEGIDGIETAKRILEKRHVPILFLSAYTDKEIVSKTESVPSYGYVVKNSGEAVLVASIKMALQLFDVKKELEEKNAALFAAVKELDSFVCGIKEAISAVDESKQELYKSHEEILLRQKTIDFERKQLLSIFDSIPESIYVCDMDTYEILYVNRTLRHILGDVVGKVCYKEFQGLDVPCDFCTNPILRRNPDEPYYWEFYNIKLNRYFSLTDRIIQWPDGRKVRLEVAKDITAQKQVESSLRTREREIRAIIDASYEAMYLITPDGKVVRSNEIGAAKLGCTVDELRGKNVFDFFDEGMRGYWQQMVLKAITAKIPLRFTDCHKGYECENSIHPVLDESGAVQHLVIFSHDITERKMLERKIKEQLEFLQNLIEAIPYPIFYKNTKGQYLGCNRAFADFWGLRCEEIVGRTDFEIMKRGIAEIICEFDDQILTANGARHYETQVETLYGDLRTVMFYKAAFPARDGSVGGIIGTIVDITEQKKIEEKLLYASHMSEINRERAEKLLEEKEMLLREVHHRVKNNLSTIVGLLSLQAQTVKDESSKVALRDAQTRVQSMVVLYDKLYTEKYFKKMPLSDYLEDLVRETVALFPNGQMVKTHIRVPEVILSAKILMPLGIIVNELVTNSMKYAFVGRKSGAITVDGLEKGNTIELSVSDNGRGLPPEVVAGASKGFGMELISLLAKQIKGDVRIISSNGATFVIEFPIK
ncbi:MAG: PAS domain S-box protein [Spirochaetes bacterium]|nr:PAS domain S-box protein [Spirochaetota bacterium]